MTIGGDVANTVGPVPLSNAGSGIWSGTAPLPPGSYNFDVTVSTNDGSTSHSTVSRSYVGRSLATNRRTRGWGGGCGRSSSETSSSAIAAPKTATSAGSAWNCVQPSGGLRKRSRRASWWATTVVTAARRRSSSTSSASRTLSCWTKWSGSAGPVSRNQCWIGGTTTAPAAAGIAEWTTQVPTVRSLQEYHRDGQLRLNAISQEVEQNKAAILDLMRKLAATNSRLGAIEIERKNIAAQQSRRIETLATELRAYQNYDGHARRSAAARALRLSRAER